MSEEFAPEAGRRRRAGRERRSVARGLALGMLAVVLIVGAAAAWLLVRGMQAERELEQARGSSAQLRAVLVDGDAAAAASTLADVQGRTSRARALTGDPVWRAVAAVPLIGRNVKAVTTTTEVVDEVAHEVLPGLVAESAALDPSTLRVAGDRIDLRTIADAAPRLAASRDAARRASARLAAAHTENLPAQVRAGIDEVRAEVDELVGLTTDAADAAALLPPMLGADGPRRYFLAFQTNAEARATGGLIGAYGVLEADRGRLRMVRLGPRSELDDTDGDVPALDLGGDYTSLYGDDPGLWVNTNLSPHFPYSARLWLAMYERQTGQELDGAIATDPVALGHLLRATGPADLPDGTRVTADSVARLTMKDVYSSIPDDERRDAFLQQVARAVVTNLFGGRGDAGDVARELGRSAGEGRLLVFSGEASEQAVLARTSLGGVPPTSDGPWVGVYANNGSGSKLDYYLREDVDYTLGACTSSARRASTVTLTLENTAPARGLPGYVTTRLDRRAVGEAARRAGPVGTNVDLMSVHLPRDAVVVAARLDGAPLSLSPQVERGRPVVAFPLVLAPGERKVVVLELSEPRSSAEPQVAVQALATPATVRTREAAC